MVITYIDYNTINWIVDLTKPYHRVANLVKVHLALNFAANIFNFVDYNII